MDPTVDPLFLGCHPETDTPHFAIQVTPGAETLLAAEDGCTWLPARTAGPSLSPQDAALMAVASGLATWNLSAQYHGTSGAKTLGANGGFSRVCPETKRSIYPRLDPAIITLVTTGDWCLLGRKEGWPEGR
jgi:NAD+ diphosphatase